MRDIVSIYLGCVNSEVIQDIVHKKHDKSQYKIQAVLLQTTQIIVMDADYSGFPKNKSVYLGACIMNDLQLNILSDKNDKSEYNTKIANNLALVSEKVINIGDEIFGNYSFQMLYVICHYQTILNMYVIWHLLIKRAIYFLYTPT